ncbi:phage holin [Macrococcoides canis]|uniref:phage holin n=1 Tax=Macrococcoides canis TaxID=1855823 RepID=UPI0022B888D5|nr:phage holin [Macrococcus canis]WBF53829.1 phage holin [Macrococcus canis]
MNINWKLRLKNKATLTALIAALALLANQVCGLIGVDYSAQIKQLVDISGTLLTILAGIGILIDPTTEGLNDSDYSHQKSEPSSNDVKVIVDSGEVTGESEVTVDVENEGDPL